MYSENFNSENDRFHRPNSMATASIVFAVMAISSISMIFSVVIFASLSILFALLSRTNRTPKRSIAGLILSLVSIIGSSFLTVHTLQQIQNNPQMLAYYQAVVRSVFDEYGMSDLYEEYFGTSDQETDSDLFYDPSAENPDFYADPAPYDSDYPDDTRSFFEDLYRYYFEDDMIPSAPSAPAMPSSPISGGDFV